MYGSKGSTISVMLLSYIVRGFSSEQWVSFLHFMIAKAHVFCYVLLNMGHSQLSPKKNMRRLQMNK